MSLVAYLAPDIWPL